MPFRTPTNIPRLCRGDSRIAPVTRHARSTKPTPHKVRSNVTRSWASSLDPQAPPTDSPGIPTGPVHSGENVFAAASPPSHAHLPWRGAPSGDDRIQPLDTVPEYWTNIHETPVRPLPASEFAREPRAIHGGHLSYETAANLAMEYISSSHRLLVASPTVARQS